MAIDIKFDLTGNMEPPTIILANRNSNKLGQLNVDAKSVDVIDKLNDASEFSFTLNKYIDGEITPLWDKVVDFKLVYCKEWDTWFEIKVELDEATETVKTVYCTQLGQAELSQINLYNIEINTEKDIERDDYKISILYDKDDPKSSILNRMLEKAPHYHIAYVAPTIANIQRSFSFDDTSIYDGLQEIAEEIGCLFDFPSNSGKDGKVQRDIFVYDLQQSCNDCGHRGEYTDKCPKCGSTNITNGYGEDTLIFVTSDELASEGIELVTDTDAVKNCFKLEAGDDLMTATVRNCNPNGTDYIWYFSDAVKEDMSEELVDKLNSYDELYKNGCNEYVSNLDVNLLQEYNSLVDKYSPYNEGLQKIESPVKGYSSLMNAYYDTIDLALYLTSGLMPSVEMSGTNAEEQASLLLSSSLSPVAVADITKASLATVNSVVLAMAKIVVRSTYKVEVKSSELYDSGNKKYWKGNFVITSYSDEEDTADSDIISVEVNDDEESFIKQKIDKALNKEDTDDLSVSGLFEMEYDDFCAELKKYALNPLTSFYDSCQTCIDILTEQGVGNGDSWSDDDEGSDANLYEKLYVPYYNKLVAIEAEMKVREDEINIISGVYDTNGNLIVNGLQTNIELSKNEIQSVLDFEKYLGEELWLEFCAYRRDGTYSNENYISDGLNNAELFKKAFEFFEVAQNEIYKSAELQHSISTTLKNLLAIPKFKDLVKSFKNGNWIRVQVDDRIYKLRLIECEIDFGDLDTISVEFSDVTKIRSGATDIQDILEQASSMATSYSSIQRQASQGNDAKSTVNQWLEKGLNSADVRIKSNNNEEVTMGKNGLLCRSYDDVAQDYSPEQFRLTHNIMAYTNDGWNTVSTALGKHKYEYYNTNKVKQEDIDYGLSAKFVSAGYINGSQIIGGEIYSQNYNSTTGAYVNLNNGEFSLAGGKIKYNEDENVLDLTGKITATSGQIGGFTIGDTYLANGTTSLVGATNSVYLGTDGISCGNTFKVTKSGKITATDVDLEGKITATDGKIGGWTISGTSLVREYTSDNITRSIFMQGYGTDTNNAIAARHKEGTDTSWKYDFYVRNDGYLYANNADIKGKITASSGSITGDLSVTGSLTHTSGNYTVTLRGVQSNTSYGVFYITDKSSGSNTYPFIVNGDGSFRATKATISGDSTFGGKLSAVSGTFTSLSAGKSSFKENQIIIDASYKDSDGQEVSKGSVYIGRSGVEGWEDITIRPTSDRLGNIGTENHTWDTMWVRGGTVSSSDRRLKKDIVVMGEKQEQLFNLLTPVIYKFIDTKNDRTHYGFISQEVEDAILKCGLETKDFAGFCKGIKQEDDGTPILDENGNQDYIYSLRYSEFIALNTHMIQKLQLENKELKERIDSLENAIERLS